MKKLVVLLFILFLCAKGWAGTYYVSNLGDNGSAGTSESEAWLTIAHLSNFSAGDNILFNKGDTWREQLTVSDSGSSGSPITYGAYGTGDDPIISGADLITPGTSWDDAYLDAFSIAIDADVPQTANVNVRNILEANESSYSGSKVRLFITAHSSSNTVITGCSIGLAESSGDEDFDAEPTRITFDTGSDTTTITAGTSKTSDEITFDFDKTKRHLIQLYFDGAVSTRWYAQGNGSGGITASYVEWSSGVDKTMVADITKDMDLTTVITVSKLQIYNSALNIWETAATTEPKTVLLDESLGLKVATVDAVDTAGDWFWSSNVLYVYGASDPDTLYTTPGIEIGQRDYGIDINSKDYISVDGLIVESANTDNIIIRGTSDHSVVENTEIRYSGARGIIWLDSFVGASNYIDTCVVHDNYEDGIYVKEHTGSGLGTESYIQDNEVYNNKSDAISIYGGSYIIIQNNDVHDNGTLDTAVHDPAWWNGIHPNAYEFTTGNLIIRYNKVYNQVGGGSDGFGIMIDVDVDGVEIYGNLTYNCDGGGIVAMKVLNAEIYNNVCYKNMQDSGSSHSVFAELQIIDDGEDWTTENNVVKNNIAYAQGLYTWGIWIEAQATTSSGLDISNNIYYCPEEAGGDFYTWGVTAGGNLATWNAYAGVGTDLNSDPFFVDASGGDFRLSPSSPCIDAGFNLGIAYDDALDPRDITFPYDLLGMGGYGDWEIGAFVFWLLSPTSCAALALENNKILGLESGSGFSIESDRACFTPLGRFWKYLILDII